MSNGQIAGNRHYPDMPPVRRYAVVRGRGARPVLSGPIYAMIGDQDALAFLNEPEKYPAVFTGL